MIRTFFLIFPVDEPAVQVADGFMFQVHVYSQNDVAGSDKVEQGIQK